MTELLSEPCLAVIIPFFQKKNGLLKECLESVLKQEVAFSYEIIVVDDGSPVSAETEIDTIVDPERRIRLIKQENAGAAAARNRGLDNVSNSIKYVAFLDSDDKWCDNFISDAFLAFQQGADFFVGNSSRYGKEGTRFDWASSQESFNPSHNSHPRLDSQREIYRFNGDFFNELIYQSAVVSTSTMAYRYDRFPALRFERSLYNGQDRLFKLWLGKLAKIVAFSPNVYAYEGQGINIFDSSSWGSDQSLRLLSNYIKLPKIVLRDFSLIKEQRIFVTSQLRKTRKDFWVSILHLLRIGKRPDWTLVIHTVRTDQAMALAIIPAVIGVIRQRIGCPAKSNTYVVKNRR